MVMSCSKIKKLVTDLGPFGEPPKIPEQNIGLIWTCIYVIMLAGIMGVIILYYSLTKHVVTRTVGTIQQPIDLATYYDLLQNHGNTLSCPCTQLAISYIKIMSINPVFHELCSSFFVSEQWINLTIVFQEALEKLGYHFTSAAFPLLASFCQLARVTVNDSISGFYASNMVSGYIIQPLVFETQSQSYIDFFKESTISSFNRALDLVRTMLNGDQVMLAYGSNFYGTVDTTAASASNATPVTFGSRQFTDPVTNQICYCQLNASCVTTTSVYVYNSVTHNLEIVPFPGFYIGCSMIEASIQSNLYCLYTQSCIDSFRLPFRIYALNSTGSDLSQTNTTIGQLIQALFVEDWNTTKSFEQYYDGCKPTTCFYTEDVYPEPVQDISIAYGLYGGLARLLTCIIPIVWKGGQLLLSTLRRSKTSQQSSTN